jgi:hypothetical protein
MEEPRFRIFENRVLRIIYGPKRKWREAVENSFITYTLYPTLLG